MKLANAELRLTLARLLFAFDISLADENDRYDWGEQNTYILWVSLSTVAFCCDACPAADQQIGQATSQCNTTAM